MQQGSFTTNNIEWHRTTKSWRGGKEGLDDLYDLQIYSLLFLLNLTNDSKPKSTTIWQR